MPPVSKEQAIKLEDIPNIGKSIATGLRAIGILSPRQLAECDPLATYLALFGRMDKRHDPCVFYTLLAARHFLDTGETVPWWTYTEQGKHILARRPR